MIQSTSYAGPRIQKDAVPAGQKTDNQLRRPEPPTEPIGPTEKIGEIIGIALLLLAPFIIWRLLHSLGTDGETERRSKYP